MQTASKTSQNQPNKTSTRRRASSIFMLFHPVSSKDLRETLDKAQKTSENTDRLINETDARYKEVESYFSSNSKQA